MSISFGIITRTTNDLDFLFNDKFNDETIVKMIKDIISINVNDSITFEIISVAKNQNQQGKRIKLLCKLDSIRHPLSIDIARSEPIHPGVKLMSYESIINAENVKIFVYPYETVIAEKLQTVVSLGLASSRVKDLFDLYTMCKLKLKNLNTHSIRAAIEMTFKHRNTDDNHSFIVNELTNTKNSKVQQNLWRNYEKKHYFAKGITHQEIVDTIIDMVNRVFDSKIDNYTDNTNA